MALMKTSDCDSKCTICLSFYTEPRLLDCYHVFCSPCLEKLVDDSFVIVCPLCRTKCFVPDKDIRELKSYPLQRYTIHCDKNKEYVKCGLCKDENIAVAKCLDCSMNICSSCSEYHGKIKSWTGHRLEPLKNQSEELLTCMLTGNRKNTCKSHKKELVLFCTPCNLAICRDCARDIHGQHKQTALSKMVKDRRYTLFLRQSTLKSRISSLESTLNKVKPEEHAYCKNIDLLKQDIKDHSTLLKEIVCKTIDDIAENDLHELDIEQRKDIKVIQSFLNETETKLLSLSFLARTVNNILSDSELSEGDFLEHSLCIGQQVDKCLSGDEDIKSSTISNFTFNKESFNKDQIRNIFGRLTNLKYNSLKRVPELTIPTPSIIPMQQTTFGFNWESIQKHYVIKGIFASENNTAWALTTRQITLHNSDGEDVSEHEIDERFTFLVKRDNEQRRSLWVYEENNVRKWNKDEETVYTVPACSFPLSFLRNGCLIVFDEKEATLNEINELGEITLKFDDNDLKSHLEGVEARNIKITETKTGKLAITCRRNSVIVIGKGGKIVEKFEKPNAQFTSVCSDNYGKLLVADFQGSNIYVLSENGCFERILLRAQSVYRPEIIDLDGCGYMWISDRTNDRQQKQNLVKIFKYFV